MTSPFEVQRRCGQHFSLGRYIQYQSHVISSIDLLLDHSNQGLHHLDHLWWLALVVPTVSVPILLIPTIARVVGNVPSVSTVRWHPNLCSLCTYSLYLISTPLTNQFHKSMAKDPTQSSDTINISSIQQQICKVIRCNMNLQKL